MVLSPGLYYVNVHTAQNGGGEIRGQLAATGSTLYFAGELRGSNEVPPNSSTAVGAYFISLDANNNLTYEINTGGLANPTASHIHGPGGSAGNSVGVFIAIATSASAFQNGRLKGVIPGSTISTLNAANLTALRANPGDFYVNVHSTLDPGGEIRGQLTPASEADVAVAGKVTNGLGQNFVTDLRVFNPSFTSPVGALIEFFPAGAANTNAAASTVANIPPRGTAIMNDVNGSTALNTTGTGALRVSSSSSLVVTSRIYNDQTAAGKGTFGQFAPGSPRGLLLLRGVLPQLSNRSDLTTGSRTNIGFFNPNADAATVRIEVRDETGTSLASAILSLAGLSQQQASIASYFPGVDLTSRPNLTLTFDSSLPIAAYGSVVDNVSSDQIFVVAQQDTGAPKS
jgi:CHRD domain